MNTSTNENQYILLLRLLEEKWSNLVTTYLSDIPQDGYWRFSRQLTNEDPEQGWKIHISATILSANEIFEKVAPLLRDLGVLFKAPHSIIELKKINCGLFYGFSQIGKFITVYPKSPEDAVNIAEQLHELTWNYPGPAVPYDRSLRQNSRIYYRYGAFGSLEVENPDGIRISAIRNKEGKLLPDLREPGKAVPGWVTDPFSEQQYPSSKASVSENLLETTFLAYEALSQRGKGGVYRALDLSTTPACVCVLKEGRKHGETDLNGQDGFWRVKHEAQVLSSLALAGIAVPKLYKTFCVGTNYYIAMEFVGGQNLQALLLERRKKIPIAEAFFYGIQIARTIEKIHLAGWAWRDCKPLNFVLSEEGILRPIDFEGACHVDFPESMPWGTDGYHPPEWLEEPATGSRIAEDLYALGVTLHQLFSGQLPSVTYPLPPIGTLRRHIPVTVRKVISALLSSNPRSRPDASTVSYILGLAAKG